MKNEIANEISILYDDIRSLILIKKKKEES